MNQRDDAAAVIRRLGLRPHPEGGHYVETWRHQAKPGERAAGSAIYFLLEAGVISRWHRVDSAEIWHHYAGASLELSIADGGAVLRPILGRALAAGERPQIVVPPGAWQRARSLGAWTLVGCTVSPAFELERFELAPDDFDPEAAGGARGGI